MSAVKDGGSVADGGGLVGVVLVSHSAAVAAAVAELARGLAGGGPAAPVAAAGGDSDGGLGTSAQLIAEAAWSVDRGAGVAVLVDLGSAVLTVKSMLADADAEEAAAEAESDRGPDGAGGGLPPRTRMLDAPFVEGAVAAVVTASAGAPLDAIESAATEAYTYRKV
ncbi:PTS fructose transporter subunit IIA [Streptomyces sp. NPDC091272]|uniref:PTS sugar transporter subunit IIA domain-containing protein n=1 Tax=Streptomyces sp. NPDC091272 TaxID=3365981 RepID=UPI003822ED5D